MTRATARHLSSWASPPPPDPGEMGRRPGSLGQPSRGWGHRFGPQVGVPWSRDIQGDEHRDRHRDKHRVAAWVAALQRHRERTWITKPRAWLGEQFSERWRRWSTLPNGSPPATQWPAATRQQSPTPRWVVVGAPETSRPRSSKSADVPLGCPSFKERIQWACT